MFVSVLIQYNLLRERRSRLRVVADEQYYIVANADNSIRVSLRRRAGYPSTFCRPLDGGGFELGYSQDPESLHMYVNDQGAVKIVRDVYATLPIFYGRSGDVFAVSNSYNEVVNMLPYCTLSTHDFMMALMPRSLPVKTTLVQEVNQLLERETLIVTEQGQRIELPPDRPWHESHTATPSNPEDFLPLFVDYLHHFTETRLFGQDVAFQVSGGLDSATLPLFMAHNHLGGRYLMRGLLPPGQAGDIQLPRLRSLEKATGYKLELEPLRLQDDFYLSHVATLADDEPIYYREQFNAVALDRDADELQRQGIAVIATGVGGDDLFENVTNVQTRFGFGDSERQARQASNFAPYFTDQFRSEYAAQTPERMAHALPHHPLSVMRSASVMNNRYIERDIWPVSPFISPDLYAFTQGLPAHFRANKNILRAYHHAHRFPAEIYGAQKIEDFSEVLCAGMFDSCNTQTLAARLIDDSVSVKKGYVDADRLRLRFTTPGNADEALMLQFWLMAERSLCGHKQLQA